ncbi:hypothetical protein PVAND_015592 [Polypedilum vanderplanki]|uniref:Uncharacterized protein n=1 Tax=Polypedilum vanderplanki TaxID=319348 RepID=A0A9J6BD38_POLVA|nr:hypothetical protein PVAND_015592 [Polypedilum vanderplanki]
MKANIVLLLLLISITLVSANENSTKEFIDGEVLDTRCCYWPGDFLVFRDFNTFKVKDDITIESNDAEILPKFKSDKIEKVELNSCFVICGFCGCSKNDSNIHNLPIKLNEVFPNLYAYVVKYTKVKRLKHKNFKNLNKLEYLTIEMSLVSKINDDAFDDLTELKALSLIYNKIHNLSPRLLKNTLKLERINLQGNKITNITKEHFGHLTNLTYLELSINKIQNLDSDVFETLVNLVELKLYENQILSLPVGIFDNLAKLEIINLGGNQLTTLDDNIFEHNNELKKIWLSHNKISKLNIKVFENTRKALIINLQKNICIDHEFGYSTASKPLSQYDINKLKNDLKNKCS